MRDASVKRWSALHTLLFTATRGLLGRRLVDNDILLLTTVGRSTGRPHTVPLLYLRDGEGIVVIASYGGRDRHPEWYRNLQVTPQVRAGLPGGGRTTMTARTASPTEREVLWPRIVDAYRGYEDYQRRTAREIPVVILSPAGTEAVHEI